MTHPASSRPPDKKEEQEKPITAVWLDVAAALLPVLWLMIRSTSDPVTTATRLVHP